MSQEKIKVVAVQNIDFTAKESNDHVTGIKIHFIRPCYDYEVNSWVNSIALKHVFVREGSSISVPKFEKLPCNAVLEYEPRGRYNALVSVKVTD